MKLTGSQFQQLQNALLDAFPSLGDLEQMVRFALGKNLNAIASGGNLNEIAFKLITWAEANERIVDLLKGACTQNAGNNQLKQCADEILDDLTARQQAQLKGKNLPLQDMRDERMVSSTSSQRQADNFQYDIFLSHSSNDKPAVRALAERLRGDGLKIWLDEWVIQPGDMIGLKVEEGLQRSRVLLLFMSQHAFQSEWVKLERHTLLFRDPTNSQRRFIPLRLDDCNIPDMIAQFAYVDWRTPNDEAYAKLCNACQPPSPPSPPTPNTLSVPESVPLFPHPKESDEHLSTSLAIYHPTDSDMIVDDPIVFGFGPINSLTVTSDGRYLIVASSNRTVKICERASGRILATLEGHTGSVNSVTVTPDGCQIISGSEDRTIKIWERANGRCLATLEGHESRIWNVAVTPDGGHIISCSEDHTVKIWERAGKHCVATLEGHDSSVNCVTVTWDGTQIVSASRDGTIKIWDRASGKCVMTLEGHKDGVQYVAVTPDGRHIISGSDDHTVKVWGIVDGRCKATLEEHQDRVYCVAVTPDGSQIISGSVDHTVKVWEQTSGRCVATLEGHQGMVWSVAVTPDGSQLISGSHDCTVKIWERASGRCLVTHEGHKGRICCVATTPSDSQIISCSHDRTIKVWEYESGRCLTTLKGHEDDVLGVVGTPDGSQIISASADYTLKIWERTSGWCVATLEGHRDRVYCVTITSDGSQIISGSQDGTIRIWGRKSRLCLATLEGHEGAVLGVAVTPDGSQIISCSADNTVKIWERANGDCLSTLEGHLGPVNAITVTSDGSHIISCSLDTTVKVWERTSGRCITTFEGHQGGVLHIAVTPDGSHIISGSDDHTVKIWDRVSGRCVTTLEGHEQSVWCVAVTPDGSKIISGSDDCTVRIRKLDRVLQQAVALSTQLADTISSSVSVTRQSSRYTNAKVVLVGESGVGKSGLALRLAQNLWTETGSTHGMEVWQLKLEEGELKGEEDDEIEREVWLWDFAGQPDYRLIHQLYMDETALALLVIDPQRANPFEPLAHWERALERALGQKHGRAPVKLLVAARCDRGGTMVSDRYIEEYCATRNYIGFLKTAAKLNDDPGCTALKTAIAQHIPWDQLPWTSTTQLFRTLKETILRIREDDMPLVRVAELRQRLQLLLPDEPFTEQDLRTVIKLLAGQGLLMELDFGDFVLLQPEQINNYASAVVYCARNSGDEIGCVGEAAVLAGKIEFHGMARLAEFDEHILLRSMLQTFLDRSLCLKEETPQGTMLVFPSYFRIDRPALDNYPGIFITYNFAGPLDEIYTTLIVRLHNTNDFEKDRLWQYAADFKTHSGRRAGLIMKKLVDDRAEIQVYFEPGVPTDTQVSFIKYIHEHLRKRADDVVRIRTYTCPKCNAGIAPSRVKQRLDSGRTNVGCDNCDANISLIDIIEDKFASDEFARTVSEMDKQAQFNLDQQSLQLLLVGHALAIATEAGQRFVLERNAQLETDGYIELRDNEGAWSDRRVYLKLLFTDVARPRARGDESKFSVDRMQQRLWSVQELEIMFVSREEDSKIYWWWQLPDSNFVEGELLTGLNLEYARKRLFENR